MGTPVHMAQTFSCLCSDWSNFWGKICQFKFPRCIWQISSHRCLSLGAQSHPDCPSSPATWAQTLGLSPSRRLSWIPSKTVHIESQNGLNLSRFPLLCKQSLGEIAAGMVKIWPIRDHLPPNGALIQNGTVLYEDPGVHIGRGSHRACGVTVWGPAGLVQREGTQTQLQRNTYEVIHTIHRSVSNLVSKVHLSVYSVRSILKGVAWCCQLLEFSSRLQRHCSLIFHLNRRWLAVDLQSP